MANYIETLASLGVTAYWSFAETTGTDAADGLGTHPGVYTGTPTLGVPPLTPGAPDGAFDTNGGTGYVVVDDPSGDIDLTPGSFVVGFWVRPWELPAGWASMFRTNFGPYILQTAAGSAQIAWWDGSASQALDTGSDTVPAGLRTFVGFEFDAVSGETSAYINGQLVASDAMPTTFSSSSALAWGATVAGDEAFNGAMDGAFIGTEVAFGPDTWEAVYEAGKFPDPEPVEWTGLRHVRIAIGTASDIDPRTDSLRYDALVVQANRTGDRDEVHAQGTETKVFAYQNLAFITEGSTLANSSSGVAEEGVDPSWYLLDVNGDPVKSDGFDYLTFADVGNAAYRQAWADQVIARCAGFDGVFIDDVNPSYEGHTDPGKFPSYPTSDSYSMAVTGALEYLSGRLREAGFLVAGNFGQWTAFREVCDDWLPFVDAALNEQGLRFSGNGVYAFEGISESTIEAALVAARFGVRCWLACPFQTGDHEGAKYGAGASMIASDGLGALVSNPWPVEYSRPAWDDDVFSLANTFGAPKGKPVKVDGVWQRRFTSGTVYVNASDARHEVRLIDGTLLTIDPKRAAFVVKPETTFGAELYRSLAPLAQDDAANGYALMTLCDAIGTMAAQLELLTRTDAEGNPPWSIIMDAERALGYMLPYIGQLRGQTIPVGTPDEKAREMIRSPSNQERGTVAKMIYEARETLTGSKFCHAIERDGSDQTTGFYVRTSECPDPDVTKAAIVAVKPAGHLVNLVVSDGIVIDELSGDIDSLSGTIDNQF